MQINTRTIETENKILSYKNILIIQDIDGVCIPLVKDPLTRKINKNYIFAAKKFNEEFFVLTCGEHDGYRGVNRIIERSLKDNIKPREKGLYLPGLAACGVEYQDNKGNISFEGVTEKELRFLSNVPNLIKPQFKKIVENLFPRLEEAKINLHSSKSICETKFSPTINFNSLFELAKNDLEKKKNIQKLFEKMMNEIIIYSEKEGLKDSFFLHISPNMGNIEGKEIIKYSTKNDIGSTDIQLLLKGAVKDAGVLFLLNEYIGFNTGEKPFGNSFNFRNAPFSIEEKISFCKKYINKEDMPLIIGVGDTITSTFINHDKSYSRGGSDRSFLELIQLLGKSYKIENKIIFVDSSSGEVFRPSTKYSGLEGITDEEDNLRFDIVFQNGPFEYINWFIDLAKRRHQIRNKN